MKNLKKSFSKTIIFTVICSISIASVANTQDANTQKIQLALLLDTSNSMDGLIDQAKSQLWRIVNEMSKASCGEKKPAFELALYEYGNDRLSVTDGYIRQLTGFTTDLDVVSEKLFSLTTNGGSEFCGEVIASSLKNLKWDDSKQSLKVIFIAGNEPFNQGRINYIESCTQAKQNDVLVNTIFCGNYTEGITSYWKKGADITSGSYMNIDQDQKTVYISTPYDDQIMQLNIILNNTYIGYGKTGASKKASQVQQDQNATQYGKANAVERATSKTKHVYKTESWDLVGASESNAVQIDKLKEDELPEEMKKMDAKQKKEFIDTKAKERAKVKSQMAELEQKRNDFIAQQKAKTATETPSAASPLEDVMLKSVKKAGNSKNFKF
ncbi:MAG: VWA domain-containing protein [Bacteroidetes bacterium]|nr:MAG: VWA domain-containing protein [Bacteroidota bacterium]